MPSPKRTRQTTRPTTWADDYLAPGDRDYLGDEEALDVAHERYLETLVRYRPPQLDPENDLTDERPKDADKHRDDEAALEVLAWRRAALAGRPLAFRDEAKR